ncbi:MAG: YegS/Rv2252/BmrU family lipid kinase [Ruminococcaceae bacterium]|nr:YegS/Rv2252/BmrU family lipid kinase [Oscillospiraceae bacterium]
MAKRMMLLVNPNAGKAGFHAVLADILHVLCDGDWLPTVVFTKYAGEAPGIVTRHACEFDMVTCLGGDGTLSEVAAGMMRLKETLRRPIGYIPLGSTNDVARTLGISFKPVEAAKALLTGSPIHYDIGQFGFDSYFTYVAAFGAFTEVSYGTPQETKQALGHLAYMLEGIRSLGKITDYHAIVEYDGGVVEDDFIFGAVTNSTSVAGMVRLGSERVNLSDGMFEVLLVRKPADILAVSDILTSVLSTDFSGPNVLFLKSSEVRFMFRENVAWTRDGEDGGSHRDVYIINQHPGVEIIV